METATKTFSTSNVSDAYASASTSVEQHGNYYSYNVTRTTNSSYNRSFDISSIPSNAVIVSASISYDFSWRSSPSGIDIWDRFVRLPSFGDVTASADNIKKYLESMNGKYDKFDARLAIYCSESGFSSRTLYQDDVVRGYGTFSNIVLTVTYEANDGTVSYGADGSWKQCKVYYGVDGSWRECKAHYGVDGDWKQVK